MAARKCAQSSSRLSKSTSLSNIQLHIGGVHFTLDKGIVAAKSAKLALFLKEYPHEDISCLLKDIPTDPSTFELVVRFCYGLQLDLTPENVVPLSCLAHSLGMTQKHSPNNLLERALFYFEKNILPGWNESVKALKSSESVLPEAAHMGLVDACFESVITKAIANPRLVGEPIQNLITDDDYDQGENENGYAPNARRQLFGREGHSEDLRMLSIQLYKPIIHEMIQRSVPIEYIVGSICQYAKHWVISSYNTEDDLSHYKRNTQKEVIEAIERLLPDETTGLVPCTLLSDMLRSAIILEANPDCRTGFEIRMGKQLEQATVKDLLIPSQGYAKEAEYDIECVRRILKNFYGNYTRSDILGLVSVSELMEDFLAEVASDVDLKPSTFVSVAEMSSSASVGTQRNSDGIYRAIDSYLGKHKYVTESEREEVCRVLDCYKMSTGAREHAAQNERLPLRLVVQVLFVGQLHLRDTIITKDCDDKEEEVRVSSSCEEEVRMEMEKMGSKVVELERECLVMKREIQSSKEEKVSMWKELKRKFGCSNGSREDYNCHVKKKKKVHPRQ